MRIKLWIKSSADRLAVLDLLNRSGYYATIEWQTQYMPPRCVVVVKVDESEVFA